MVIQKFLSRTITLSATPNTLQNLRELILALSPTPTIPEAVTQLILYPTGAGNLMITDDSTATTEAGGAAFTAGDGINFPASGSPNDTVNTTEIWVLSATASKTFSIMARSEVG